MGLASKLQASQGAPNPYGAPAAGAMPGAGPAGGGGMMMGAPPSAPPMPGGPPAPYPAHAGAPGPYGQMPPAGAPQGPYPPQQQQQGPAAGAGGYPSPYPPAAGMPGQPGQPAPYGAARPPYPGSAPPGAAPYPGAPPQQQQQGMHGAMPGSYPGQGPPMQQQQQMRPPGAPGGYPAAGVPPQQQQPYGAAPAAGPGMASSPGGMAAAIQAKLEQCIATNQLAAFYPPGSAGSLASKLDARVNFRDLASRWSMPVELALDLAALSLYDVVIVADDSGSMAFEENGERIDDLKMIAQKVSEVATLFDDDGILVRFMNSDVQGNSIRSPGDVSALLSRVQYSGLTPLATSLRDKVLSPIVFSLAASGQLAKPVLVITITDGEPTDTPKDLVAQVISDARNRLAPRYGPKAVAFEFAQVGKDQRAQAFLATLDTHPVVGGSIDCTSYYELESAEYQRKGINLSPSMWLVKMMMGAIDPSYDEGDEG